MKHSPKSFRTSRRRSRRSVAGGFRDGSCTHTVSYRDKLTASSNVIFQEFIGADFTGLGDFAFLFLYAKPLSYRIRVYPISINDITSGYACVVPINPLTNVAVTHNLVDPERIGEVRGNVGLWNSMPIESPWIRWPFPNVGLESLFVRDNTLGYFLAYSADSATFDLSFEVQMTFRFTRRQMFNTFLSPIVEEKSEYSDPSAVITTKKDVKAQDDLDPILGSTTTMISKKVPVKVSASKRRLYY